MANNPYLSVEGFKKYCPKILREVLFDYSNDGSMDDDAVQQALDDAVTIIRGLNPNISDPEKMRIFSARYVMVQAWRQMGKYDKANEEEKLLLDTVRRTTGQASQDKSQNGNVEVCASGEPAWEFER